MAHPLLKKSEHKREEPKLGEPKLVQSETAPEIPIAQALTGESVADTLIRARQQLGQDLRSIAEVLCIRYSYLDAIERGQYENLPGPTYAVGFMRSYADYLGLDGDEIVERFKSEVEGLDSQTKLHFPTPAPEGKMPGGAVFLVAALLFAGAYGVWFYLSNQGETLGDLVAPVPEQLQQMVDGGTPATEQSAPAPATPAPAAPARAAQDPAAPQAGSPVAETPAPAEPAPPAQTAMTSPGMTPPGTTPSGEDAVPAATTPPAAVATPQPETPPAARGAAGQTSSTQAPATEAPAAPAVSADQGAVTLPQPSADEQAVVSVPEAPAASAEDAPAAPAQATSPYAIPAAPDGGASATAFLMNHQPTVYGEENADARIVLKATQDAWVQVRDREGNLLLTRVLRVGDSYKVPNQADLTLLTGNAGGLEITVDGGRLPALGPVGAVRRNIPLDPQALRDGAGQQP